MKRRKLFLCLVAACLLPRLTVNAADDTPVEITTTAEDEYPIPDKYTTGASGELTKVALGDTVSGIVLKASGTKEANTINFAYPVSPIPDTAVIENCDFSDYKFSTLGDETVTDRDVKIIFRNCRFGTISKGAVDSRVYYVFENCSLNYFTGSNASFENCAIGGTYQDGMHPFRHVSVKNCYFSDFNYVCTEGEYHTDGVHVFGKKGVDVTDLNFEHCRFEAPYNQLEGSNAYVNACFMLAPEYSDASYITVKDCIMNGGGFTIYASDGEKHGEFHSITNSRFENVLVGEAHLFGDIYPNARSEGAEFINLGDVDSLYIGAVGKEDGNTWFSVTNDTDEERILKIVTDGGSYTETIPACPGGKDMRYVREKIDYPFDRKISIPVDAGYAVCFDLTDPEDAKQIRFVNYGTEPVYLTKDLEPVNGKQNEDPDDKPSQGTELRTDETGKTLYYEDGAWKNDFTSLVKIGKDWYYIENGVWISDKYGFIEYEGYLFIVANGVLAKETGLVMDPNSDKWYFCAEGQVVKHTGLAMYDGEWFYVENGVLDTGLNALVEYNGGLFYVAAGRLLREVNGLAMDPNSPDWYFVALGEVQVHYTGLAYYNGDWFYVDKGKLAVDYTGEVEYDGLIFQVENGMVK